MHTNELICMSFYGYDLSTKIYDPTFQIYARLIHFIIQL